MGRKDKRNTNWSLSSPATDLYVVPVKNTSARVWTNNTLSHLEDQNNGEDIHKHRRDQAQAEEANSSELSSNGKENLDGSGSGHSTCSMDTAKSTSDAVSVQEVTFSKLRRSMTPLFISLFIGGLFYKKSPRYHPSKIYSRILLVILWLDCLKQYSSFKGQNGLDVQLFMSIVFVNFKTGGAIAASVCHYAAGSANGIHEYYEEFMKVVSVKSVKSVGMYTRKRIIIYCVICWLFVIYNSAYSIYGIYRMDMMQTIAVPFPPDWQYIQVVQALNSPLMFFWTIAYIFPILFYYSTCSLLCWAFNELNKEFRSIEDNSAALKSVECYRYKHQALCGLVRRVNDIFHVLVANYMVSSVLSICLTIYLALRSPLDEMIAMASWILVSIFTIGAMSLGAGYVNASAHSIADRLYELDLSKATEIQIAQATFFHNRLTGTSIGLSALKLVIIDKSNILTLFGLILTYLIVLVEFTSQDSSNQTCDCLKDILNSTMNSTST